MGMWEVGTWECGSRDLALPLLVIIFQEEIWEFHEEIWEFHEEVCVL